MIYWRLQKAQQNNIICIKSDHFAKLLNIHVLQLRYLSHWFMKPVRSCQYCQTRRVSACCVCVFLVCGVCVCVCVYPGINPTPISICWLGQRYWLLRLWYCMQGPVWIWVQDSNWCFHSIHPLHLHSQRMAHLPSLFICCAQRTKSKAS